MLRAVKITIFCAFIAFSAACKKKDPVPEPPIISFKSALYTPFTTQTSSFNSVVLEFTDADGDLGLKQDENTGEFEYNFFAEIYALENGVWNKKTPLPFWVQDLTDPINGGYWDTLTIRYRVPFIENESQQSLLGEIAVDIVHDAFIAPFDTIRYEIYIKDRALQSSNKVFTDPIYIY